MPLGKWWDKDPRDMTVLENIHGPLSISRYNSLRFNRPRAYEYYDTPEGQDIDKKLWVSFKWGASTGTFFGIIDNRLYSNPPTILHAVNRFAWFFVPFTGMFTAFTAVTYAATNLRGKDDPLNGALGGVVAGSLAGVWQKSGQIGFLAALFVGLFGACRRYSQDLGYEFFDSTRMTLVYGDHRTPFHDSSLTPEGEKGWTTGRESM